MLCKHGYACCDLCEREAVAMMHRNHTEALEGRPAIDASEMGPYRQMIEAGYRKGLRERNQKRDQKSSPYMGFIQNRYKKDEE